MEYLFKQRDDYENSTSFSRFQADGAVEIVTKFREFLLGCGFHLNTVNEYVPDPYGVTDCCPSHDVDDDEDPFAPIPGAHL